MSKDATMKTQPVMNLAGIAPVSRYLNQLMLLLLAGKALINMLKRFSPLCVVPKPSVIEARNFRFEVLKRRVFDYFD